MEDHQLNGLKEVKSFITEIMPHTKFLPFEINYILNSLIKKEKKTTKTKVILSLIKYLDSRQLFIRNSQSIEKGIYRSMEGNADELIVVGKLIKMGYNCSRVDVTNSKYDAVIDKNGQILRIQIKATNTNNLSLTCGSRSGKQIDRQAKSRERKMTEEDCDILIGVTKESAICFVIPAKDLKLFGKNISLSKLEKYKEQWNNIK